MYYSFASPDICVYQLSLNHISQCSLLFLRAAEPLSGVLLEDDSQNSPRLGLGQGEPLKGDQDLLTCGQCHSRFPLADILLFIEHKRRQCHGSLCMDKPLDRPPSSPLASPLSTSSLHSRTHHQHPRRARPHVGVASPRDEDCLSAPLQGIIPKQENITGKHNVRSTWLASNKKCLMVWDWSHSLHFIESLFQKGTTAFSDFLWCFLCV